MSTPVPVITGYEDLRLLGRGGFATVYRARQVRFQREVAIKVVDQGRVDDQMLELFTRECLAVGQLSWHPHVVAVHDAAETEDGRPYLAMELLPGGSVEDALAAGPLPLATVGMVGTQVADALAAAHDVGVLHRDVKPANILIDRRGAARLADFGIARMSGLESTVANALTGTLAYMAPELMEGARASVASDVYGLGMTLTTMALGANPHTTDDPTPFGIIHRVTSGPTPDLRAAGLPDPLADLLGACISRDPGARPRSAAEVQAALAALTPADDGAAGDETTALLAALPPPPSPSSPTHRVAPTSPDPIGPAAGPPGPGPTAGAPPPPTGAPGAPPPPVAAPPAAGPPPPVAGGTPPPPGTPGPSSASGRPLPPPPTAPPSGVGPPPPGSPPPPGAGPTPGPGTPPPGTPGPRDEASPARPRRQRAVALGAAAVVLALVAAAAAVVVLRQPAAGGEALRVGRTLPDSDLIGPPMAAGLDLAIADINAAGGVLGEDVEAVAAPDYTTAEGARADVAELLDDGIDALVGPGSTSVAEPVLPLVAEAGIPQCSGSVTAPDVPDAPTFFRTIATDEAEAVVLADLVAARDPARTVVVARDDTYGTLVGQRVVAELGEADTAVDPLVTFPEGGGDAAALAAEVAGRAPDAVVVVGFAEGATVTGALVDAGVPADRLLGSEGAFNPAYPPLADPEDPAALDGMVVVAPAGDATFARRLGAETEGNVVYGAPTYDCAVVLALAVEAAGSTDGAEVLAEVPGVTRDGEPCGTFAGCRDLLEDGRDIDYDGPSGALDLDDRGDVTRTRYTIGRVEGGTVVVTGSQDVDA
ncbi:bifunctional serine/threonine-protein kinase/ABC transporter substrate-binding protein [Iamia majanohamensis]|uniref:non-specific serine/threonine protein kinase n=1 Tax=Iamia majanohamensis TaxID=467976 RepID=A0AAE9Y3N1_9ACTN|nr:bifunctional serine/threonine-protein kinase/ABC transporter substrate-binding protein [Iamia majanohamensis]WCO65915.1 bifunctional serine/threonine-protein kinase/ABC transporter substrate-binding protein [Iamia majanohamensis]